MRGFLAVCRGYLECQPSFLVPPETSASLLTAKAITGEVKRSCATLGELSKYERVRHIFFLESTSGHWNSLEIVAWLRGLAPWSAVSTTSVYERRSFWPPWLGRYTPRSLLDLSLASCLCHLLTSSFLTTSGIFIVLKQFGSSGIFPIFPLFSFSIID